VLDATGDYTIIAFEIMGAASGPYSMFVQDVADPVGATQLTYGTSYAATMAQAAVDTYTFEAEANDSLVVKFTEIVVNTINPHLRVYRPDGTLLCQGSSNSAVLTLSCVANVTGSYTVLVAETHRGGQGSYEMLITAQ